MSLTNVGDGSSRFGSLPFLGSRSRISWGAVLAGAVVAAATSLLLSLLGAAFGAGSIGELTGEANGAGVGAVLWTIIDLALSMAFGGYVASRLSGTHSHLDGELHGITMWALATLIGVLGFATAMGSAIERMGFNVGPAIIGTSGQTLHAGLEGNPQQFLDNFEASLGRTGDPTTMTHEQIGAEIRSLLGGELMSNGSFSATNRGRLIALVAAQYGLTTDQATQRVARLESDAAARIAAADQRARALADEASQAVASGARALFTSLVFGLLGALVGAWLGTRHKRVLHSHETQVVAAPLAVHEYNAHHYDDASRVGSYLRGLSFPASKQDLLRYARAGNAGSDILHTIEGLADRSYASANDVLASAELVH